MFEWLSDHRASIALVVIIGLAVAFVASIQIGLKQTRLRAKDQVFGDPDRTKGGWFWALCGVSALLLVWTTQATMRIHRTMPRTSHLWCDCLLYTSPSPRDRTRSRMPSSA